MLRPYLPHSFCFTPFIFLGGGGGAGGSVWILRLINPAAFNTPGSAPARATLLSPLSQPLLPIFSRADFPGHLVVGKVQLGSGLRPG